MSIKCKETVKTMGRKDIKWKQISPTSLAKYVVIKLGYKKKQRLLEFITGNFRYILKYGQFYKVFLSFIMLIYYLIIFENTLFTTSKL